MSFGGLDGNVENIAFSIWWKCSVAEPRTYGLKLGENHYLSIT
jgi:hypothetical protein